MEEDKSHRLCFTGMKSIKWGKKKKDSQIRIAQKYEKVKCLGMSE